MNPDEEEPVVEYRVYSECGISSCGSCSLYRQLENILGISYRDRLRKAVTERNISLFVKIVIFAVSFLASVINFSRLADFKEEQLYLETILSVLFYYLTTTSVTGATALLVGGLFHWLLAFGTRSKYLTLFVMTLLQVPIESLRYYEWFTMAEHLFMSCVADHITMVLKTHYVTILVYCVATAYCFYAFHFGIGIEDLLLSVIIIFSNHYATTGDPNHCYLKDNVSSLIIWIILKEIREATGYSGLGFRLF